LAHRDQAQTTGGVAITSPIREGSQLHGIVASQADALPTAAYIERARFVMIFQN
jgi:hypothetical protein